ncbi:TPA: DNA-directed DNA polymerase [Trebouxia sp. C0004]
MTAVNGVDAIISARDVGEQVLKFFWDLASLNEDARATAAAGLVAELQSIQAEFSLSSAGSKQQATYAPSLMYGLKRLVRGLASGRQGARQGYALALSNLLADIPALSITEVLATMASELEVSGQAKGSEAHDQLLGQVFGYAAIIRSGLQIDQQTAVTCAEGLTHIANKKSFLRELAANVLLELTEQLEDTTLTHILEQESCGLKEWLMTSAVDASPEVLLLALRLWGLMPSTLLKQTGLLPSNVQPPSSGFFTASDMPKDAAAAAAAFFSEQHLQTVLPVLRGSSSSHPRLHSVWPTVFALLLPGFKAVKDLNAADSGEAGSKGTAAAGQLEALWTIVVQDLFTSSHERKALGFQLFTILLPFLRPEQLPVVFSTHFLRCFTNNLTNSKTYLHSSAQRCAQRIVAFADKTKATPRMQTALAVALQGVGGHGFDKLTRTTTVAKLLQNLDAASLEPYVQRLQGHFCKGSKSGSNSDDDEEIQKARQVAVEQMCNMAAITTVPASVKTAVLKFLAVHAFFVVDKAALGKGKPKEVKAALEAQPAPSAATRQVCAARLIALLDSATKAAQAPPGPVSVNIKKESKTKKRKAAELVAEAAASAPTAEAVQAARLETPFLTEIVAFVSKVQRTAGVSLAAELPEEMDAALSQLRESEALAANKLAAGVTGVQAQQVRSMVGLMRWLQLYILSDPAAAQPDVAADLQGVFNGAFRKSKPAADEPHWMDVLVDILLSLLGRSGDALPFGPLREACEALFRAFADQVTSQGFADLVRVVQQPPEGQADEEEDDDVFEDDDEDMLAGTAEDGDTVYAAQSTDDDAEEDEEDDEADGTADDAALNADEGSSGSDSSDEEDFDDDQMFNMDDKIAAALRVMARGGANARESREAIATFKFRVIGLMEIYMKKVPTSPLLAAAVPALLGALTGACQQGGDAALAKRLHALLMLFAKGHAHSVPSASGASFAD